MDIKQLHHNLSSLVKFVFVDHGPGDWPGKVIFTCFSHSITIADECFKTKFGFDVRGKAQIGCQIHPVTVGDVLLASNLFSSKSDILRTIKQNGVKLNRQLVEFNELLEMGDFQNFVFIGGADQFGGLLVSKGKNHHAWMVLESGQFKKVN